MRLLTQLTVEGWKSIVLQPHLWAFGLSLEPKTGDDEEGRRRNVAQRRRRLHETAGGRAPAARAIPDTSRAASIDLQTKGFACVEDINNDPSTAPSKRLAQALGPFSKVRLGPIVTARLGIDRLRTAAPRFSSWVGWLESLGVPIR